MIVMMKIMILNMNMLINRLPDSDSDSDDDF